MLPAEENKLITRSGPGTPMGELFRRYWLPAMLSEELPHAGLHAREADAAGRGPRRLPRHERPHRRARPLLPAPQRQPVLGPQRGSTACAASTTAGSSTSTATASTCRTSPQRAASPTR